MISQFDLNKTKTTVFGVGFQDRKTRSFANVSVDAKVQAILRDMVNNTMTLLTKLEPAKPYDPSQKHGAIEYLVAKNNDKLCADLAAMHAESHFNESGDLFNNPQNLFCYFARFTDSKNRRLTAIRQARNFKSICKGSLILRAIDDTLTLAEKNTAFKLDADFDVLIDDEKIHVLRPSSFVSLARLRAALLEAAPQNAKALGEALDFLDTVSISDLAKKSTRVARCLASIQASSYAQGLEKKTLTKLCKEHEIEYSQPNGKMQIEHDCVVDFLELINRQRFQFQPKDGAIEHYRAASREAVRAKNKSSMRNHKTG